jgi:hypothetical protein
MSSPRKDDGLPSDTTMSDGSGYRWWQALFLVAIFAAGLVLLGLAVRGLEDADRLDAASVCKADAASTTGCYQLVRATVLNEDSRCHGIFCWDDVTLQMGEISQTVRVHDHDGLFALRTVVTAKVYYGKITDVETSGQDLVTDDHPGTQAANFGFWGLGLTFFGGLLCIPLLLRLQRRRGASSGTGWAVVLAVPAFFFLVVGAASATESHLWTPLWPLNAVGGLMSCVPFVVWVVYGHRVSNQSPAMWPARVLALMLTFAIPLAVWAPVPRPPS